MPSPEAIRAQTTPEDGALFVSSYTNSKYVVQPHLAFTDDVRQKIVYQIQNTVSGSEVIINFEKESTLLEDVDVYLTPEALPIPQGATYARYCDWLGFAIYERIEWKYGGNTIQTYYPDPQWSEIQYYTNEHKTNAEKMYLGNLSAAARNTYALNPTPIRLKIPTPWDCCRFKAPCIAGLANKLQINIRLNPCRYFIQSDGAKPQSINFTNIHCDHQNIHFTGSDRSELVGVTMTPQGISILYDDQQISNVAIPANTFNANTSFVYELRDFDGPIYLITSILRTKAQLDPTNNDVDPYAIDTTYINNLQYEIVSNSMFIQDPEDENITGIYKIDKFWDCVFTVLQATYLFSEYPKEKNVASGSISFGNFTNPKLTLRNPTLLGNHPELVLTNIAHRWNWIVQQRGNYQKVWR